MTALKTKQAAAYLSISRTKLYDLVRDGEIAYCDLGGQFGFLTADLDDYLRRHRIERKPDPIVEARREPLGQAGAMVSIFTGKPLRGAVR